MNNKYNHSFIIITLASSAMRTRTETPEAFFTADFTLASKHEKCYELLLRTEMRCYIAMN